MVSMATHYAILKNGDVSTMKKGNEQCLFDTPTVMVNKEDDIRILLRAEVSSEWFLSRIGLYLRARTSLVKNSASPSLQETMHKTFV